MSEHQRTCEECHGPLPQMALTNRCVPCQERSIKWCSNPKNFEGERWKWEERFYGVIYMATGALQSGTISRTKDQSWLRFGAQNQSHIADYMKMGFRVKKLSIKPAWKTKK